MSVEWKSVVTFDSIRKVISRTGSRAFFGLPLCLSVPLIQREMFTIQYSGRNPGWLELSLQFSFGVIISATRLGFFPRFLWPWVVKAFQL